MNEADPVADGCEEFDGAASSWRPARRIRPGDLVPLATQQLGEVGPVLTGDPGDERPSAGHEAGGRAYARMGLAGARPEPRRSPRPASCHRGRLVVSSARLSLAAAFHRNRTCDAALHRPPTHRRTAACRVPLPAPPISAPDTVDVLGVPLALTDYEGTLDWIDATVGPERGYVCVAAVAHRDGLPRGPGAARGGARRATSPCPTASRSCGR